MKVTPVKKKFGKHAVGDVFDLPDGAAKLFIKVGKLRQADAPAAAQTYQTRMMQAEPVAVASPSVTLEAKTAETDPAPYGYKADGTPRKRPAPAPRKASE